MAGLGEEICSVVFRHDDLEALDILCLDLLLLASTPSKTLGIVELTIAPSGLVYFAGCHE